MYRSGWSSEFYSVTSLRHPDYDDFDGRGLSLSANLEVVMRPHAEDCDPISLRLVPALQPRIRLKVRTSRLRVEADYYMTVLFHYLSILATFSHFSFSFFHSFSDQADPPPLSTLTI